MTEESKKRRITIAINALIAGSFVILVLLAAMLPMQEKSLEKQVSEERAKLQSDAYKEPAAKLEELRALKKEQKSFEPSQEFLAGVATDFGTLLNSSLGKELLKDADVLEAVYDEQTDLILDLIIPDAEAFEQTRSRINDERSISVTEAAPPEELEKTYWNSPATWRVQIHVTSFETGGGS
jgi:hypothetical protein